MARFMTPDWAAKPTAVPYASFGNPQSLNLYSYVKDNPTAVRDPDGHQEDDDVKRDENPVEVKEDNEKWDEAGRALSAERYASQSELNTRFIENLKANGGDDPVTGMCYAPQSKAEGTVTRYMGPAEAAKSESSGYIPNVDPEGNPRPTHVTTDPPMDSAAGAKQKYELPTTPTHRATVPASQAGELGPTPDGRPRTSGGGSQAATNNPIPVKPEQIKPLNQ